MADQKKAPQLFHSDLFSSPSSSGSTGLSLGFDESFSSPFSLAPASQPDGEPLRYVVGFYKNRKFEFLPFTLLVAVSKSPASTPSKASLGATPPSSGSPRQERRSKSPSNVASQQLSTAPSTTASSSGAVSLAELSTIPLDSPVNTSTTPRLVVFVYNL